MHAHEHAFSYTPYTLHDRAGTHASHHIYRAFSTRDPGYRIISFAYASAILVHHAAVTSVSVVESVVAEVSGVAREI